MPYPPRGAHRPREKYSAGNFAVDSLAIPPRRDGAQGAGKKSAPRRLAVAAAADAARGAGVANTVQGRRRREGGAPPARIFVRQRTA